MDLTSLRAGKHCLMTTWWKNPTTKKNSKKQKNKKKKQKTQKKQNTGMVEDEADEVDDDEVEAEEKKAQEEDGDREEADRKDSELSGTDKDKQDNLNAILKYANKVTYQQINEEDQGQKRRILGNQTPFRSQMGSHGFNFPRLRLMASTRTRTLTVSPLPTCPVKNKCDHAGSHHKSSNFYMIKVVRHPRREHRLTEVAIKRMCSSTSFQKKCYTYRNDNAQGWRCIDIPVPEQKRIIALLF
jgi:hypothetical protein